MSVTYSKKPYKRMSVPDPISPNHSSRKRFVEIDILRVMAIMAIIVCHIPRVIHGLDIPMMTWIENIFMVCGLSLFFMLSGYSLMLKDKKFDTFGDVTSFYKKRLLRLFPLYWIAIMIAFIFQPLLYPTYHDFSYQQYIITIAGLQIIFTSIVNGGLTWFVSAILFCYLVFPMIIMLARNFKISFTQSITLSGTIIFALFVLTSLILSVDIRFFAYYWFFIAGIILGKEVDLTSISAKSMTNPSIIAIVGLGILFSIQKIDITIVGIFQHSLPPDIFYLFFVGFVGIIGISVCVVLTMNLRAKLSGLYLSIIKRTASSTYSIYFFHIYFLSLAASLASIISIDLVPFFVLIFGIPMALILPPYLEKFVDMFIFKLVDTVQQ